MSKRVWCFIALAAVTTVSWGGPSTGDLERVFIEAHQKGIFDGVALVAQHGRVPRRIRPTCPSRGSCS